MKSTNQNNSTINFKTIFYSGILSTLVIGSCLAKDSCIEQQFIETETALVSNPNPTVKREMTLIIKPTIHQETEKEIAELTEPIQSNHEKTVLETIVENEQIIESTADFDLPLYAGRTLTKLFWKMK
jgi:hypothetical protein